MEVPTPAIRETSTCLTLPSPDLTTFCRVTSSVWKSSGSGSTQIVWSWRAESLNQTDGAAAVAAKAPSRHGGAAAGPRNRSGGAPRRCKSSCGATGALELYGSRGHRIVEAHAARSGRGVDCAASNVTGGTLPIAVCLRRRCRRPRCSRRSPACRHGESRALRLRPEQLALQGGEERLGQRVEAPIDVESLKPSSTGRVGRGRRRSRRAEAGGRARGRGSA